MRQLEFQEPIAQSNCIMLKHIAAVFAAFILISQPSEAQSAAEIAKAKSGQSCQGCNLFQADFSYQGIRDVDLSGSRLRQSNLSLSTMNGVDFSGANLSIANLFGGRFTGANFSRANLQSATLVGGYFSGANFSGANLAGANLSGAELQRALGLTQSQLDQACGDQFTELRAGLTIPRCK